MASSNGTEVGILGTTEAGETPLWKQYTFVGIFSFYSSLMAWCHWILELDTSLKKKKLHEIVL